MGIFFLVLAAIAMYFSATAIKASNLMRFAWSLSLVFVFGIAAAMNASGPTPQPVADSAPIEAPADTPKPEPTATPDPPTPKPTSLADAKREFLQYVDESISGARIAGNKLKFVGTNVDLHGIVGPIVDEHEFNLMTGSISADDTGNVSDTTGTIVVTCDSTTNLEKGQRIRVMGTVVQPSEGTNAMGGAMTFPTVAATFME